MQFHYVKVWDGWVRMNHWLILVLMLVSFGTAKSQKMDWHMLSGYAILTLLIFRLLWGVFGSDTARFATFLAWPGAAWRQLARLGRREPDTEVSHNPAGGWMVVLLLVLLFTQATSGLFTYDQVFTRGPLSRLVSEEWVDLASTIHVKNFYWLLGVIAAHVVAVGVYFVAKSHDLLGPMIHGEKKLPANIPAPRMASPERGLALLALSAAIVWGITRMRIGL
jgi:cytochrome b